MEKAMRRAAIRIRAEAIVPESVFDRDGYHCRACGCATPSNLRGSTDDNAPELDHIVPLCLGGPHTLMNLQTLCRVCNILKGAKTMEAFMYQWIGGGYSTLRPKDSPGPRLHSRASKFPLFNPPSHGR
jgi:5-methylcytosine-specific restriction endonuclease McrA